MSEKPETITAPAEEAPEQAAATPKFETIDLEQPIVRGKTTIAALQLRKPQAGELRGLKVQDLMQGDVNSILTVLPRISSPPITVHEAEALDPADLGACAGAVMGFFMSKTDQSTLARFMGMTEESTG